jgi:hypothetical protein
MNSNDYDTELLYVYPMGQVYWDIEEYELEDLCRYDVSITNTGIVYYTETGIDVVNEIGKKGIFVLTSDGRLRVGSRKEIHHSDLTHGLPVRCAGEITFSKKGKIKSISNKSGHFIPHYSCMEDVLIWIEEFGVDTDSIEIKMFKN